MIRGWTRLLPAAMALLLIPVSTTIAAPVTLLDQVVTVRGDLFNACELESVPVSGRARVKVEQVPVGGEQYRYEIRLTYLDLSGYGEQTGDTYRTAARGTYEWSYVGESMRTADSPSALWHVVSSFGAGGRFQSRVVNRLLQEDEEWAVHLYYVETTCR